MKTGDTITVRFHPKAKPIPEGWSLECAAHELGHHGRYSILIREDRTPAESKRLGKGKVQSRRCVG